MRLSIVVMAVLLVACAERSAADAKMQVPAQGAHERRAPVPGPAYPVEVAAGEAVGSSSPAMPGDACTPDGYWSFFEAFVRVPALRATHSDDAGRVALQSFDIAQQDSRWVRASDPTVTLDIKEQRDVIGFEVATTPVELDADDNVIRALGPVARYRFEFKDPCWQFVGMP